MEFHRFVADVRKGRGITQAQMSEEMKITQPQMFQLEAGKRRTISGPQLEAIRRVLDLTQSQIDAFNLTWEPSKQVWIIPKPLPVEKIQKALPLEKVHLEPIVYRVERFSGKILTNDEEVDDPSDVIEVRPFVTVPARISVQMMCSMQVTYGSETEGAEWRGVRVMREIPCYREEMDVVEAKLVDQVRDDVIRERDKIIREVAVDHFGAPRQRTDEVTISEFQ